MGKDMIVRDMTGCRVICVLRRAVPVMAVYVVTGATGVHGIVQSAPKCVAKNVCSNVRTVTIPSV